MAKKVIKKQRLRIFPLFIFIIICVLLYFLIKVILAFRIQNIYIIGNNYLNDEYIISLAAIEDYPSYVKILTWNLEKKLESDPYIKSSKVTKSFFGVIEIEIEEREVLFFKEYNKKYVLDNEETLDDVLYDVSVPRVINYVPDLIYASFFEEFSKLNREVRMKISQIKYSPNEYDDGRFLLYMVDGNYVYATVSKFDLINYYNEIYPTLEGKKGTLFLDSGNHFQEFK
jgi:cell division septal protein FtsQ